MTTKQLVYGHKIALVRRLCLHASEQRPDIFTEWQLVDIALQSYGKVGVSLYDTLGKDSVGG